MENIIPFEAIEIRKLHNLAGKYAVDHAPQWLLDDVHYRIQILQAGLLKEFAQNRDWIIAKTNFNWSQLREGRHGRLSNQKDIMIQQWDCRSPPEVDHVEYFRECYKPFRPAAVLSHSYVEFDMLTKFANENFLYVEKLPYSWYYPGEAVAGLFTRRNGNEQN